MVFQPEYGRLLSMPAAVAGEPLPYYRFIAIKENKFVLATEGSKVVGVTVPSVQDYAVLKDGTTQKRVGYLTGEKPQILLSGVCHVELEENEVVTMSDYVMLGTEGGKAKKHPEDGKNTSKVLAMALDKQEGGTVRVALKVL